MLAVREVYSVRVSAAFEPCGFEADDAISEALIILSLAEPGSASGCGDRSYARLILDLQERGAAGVVVGAPEGSDVFQLECRRALSFLMHDPSAWSTRSWPMLRHIVLGNGSMGLPVLSAMHPCRWRDAT